MEGISESGRTAWQSICQGENDRRIKRLLLTIGEVVYGHAGTTGRGLLLDALAKKVKSYAESQSALVRELADIGLALSSEKRVERLLEMIVTEARHLTNADAGTLYIVDDAGKNLQFVILQNDTMNTRLGGESGDRITLPPVPLFKADGSANHGHVSSHVALSGQVVHIEDVYEAEGFDFTGPKKYDAATGYRSRSMLVLPLRNHENDIIGVLQLLNAKDRDCGEVTAFDAEDLDLVGSLASQAAVALTNAQLIRDLQRLLYSFIQSIATAIDAKSPYTAGHIDRVVELTMMIAEAINREEDGAFAAVRFSDQEMEELKLAAWMHDVGKITTPEHVVDKSVKLETIFDRSELLRTRFALFGQAVRVECAERRLELALAGASPEVLAQAEAECRERLAELEDELAFLLSCNNPGEFMSEERLVRLRLLASKTRRVNGEDVPCLTPDELDNLSVRKGSLTDAERKIIENHAVVTYDMLSRLPFPKRLARVPDYAGGHHEKLDGSGYPRKLKAGELPIQARILAVADIFEALTARDRPYKKPMKLSQAVKILGFMEKDGHIDPEVFRLFIGKGLHRDYAARQLNPDQVDEV